MSNQRKKDEAAERAAKKLIEAAVPDDELRRALDAEDTRAAVAKALREIEALENAQPEGGTSIKIGDASLSLTETTWVFLEAAIGLALLAAGPDPITKTAGGGFLADALFKARNLIQTLDQTDQAVCTAVIEQRRQKKRRSEAELRVTAPEIVAYFHGRDEDAPRDLEKILDELVSEKVLKRERENDVAYYSMEF
ncbi:MAG: hypothetical protein AAF495_08595 [Pseudomonadota bacterium]